MKLFDGECFSSLEHELIIFEGLKQSMSGFKDRFEFDFHISLNDKFCNYILQLDV